MIAVIDYNMGNVWSVLNMLKKLSQPALLTRNREHISEADGIILPGLGSFDRGIANIHELDLYNVLNECALTRKVPILGICLGMQLLTERSEEGSLPGLGWIPSHTKRFNFGGTGTPDLKVPHMGWNYVKLARSYDSGNLDLAARLFVGTEDGPSQRYYFTHSYHACCYNSSDVLATCTYGYEFAAAIGRGNIVGTQFHPEKSHRYGLKLLGNFARHVATSSTARND